MWVGRALAWPAGAADEINVQSLAALFAQVAGAQFNRLNARWLTNHGACISFGALNAGPAPTFIREAVPS